jgi:Zn-dependent protease with chaperone function
MFTDSLLPQRGNHGSSRKVGSVAHYIFEQRTYQRDRARVRRWLWLIALLLAKPVYPQSAPEFPNPGNAHMSREKQRALGLEAAAQVYKQMPVLPDNSPETRYIAQLGQKLVATIPAEYSWPFEFHVVAQKDINAFALPGGPMFINLGAITAAANEAELAGVMAHEMSHVYMQHSAKQAHKAETTGVLEGLAGAVLGATMGGAVGQLGEMGIQMTAQGVMLKYSRGDESQADAVGAIILYTAGYNPQALADFFKTLESQGGAAPPQWLSDHPNPGNRQQAIQKEIENWPAKSYVSNSPAFQKVRQQAMGVKAYTAEEIAQGAKSGQWSALNAKNGSVFDPTGARAANAGSPVPASSLQPDSPAVALESILPAAGMLKADLGAVKIEYPENWQVLTPKQRGQFVTIAPQAGISAKGVGYGAVINGVAPPHGERMSIDDVTRLLVQEMKQNSGLQPVDEAQPVTVGGIEGRSVNLQSTSPFLAASGQPQKERDWMVTIPQRDSSVIFIVFVAPEKDFDRFRPTFEAMLRSMAF